MSMCMWTLSDYDDIPILHLRAHDDILSENIKNVKDTLVPWFL